MRSRPQLPETRPCAGAPAAGVGRVRRPPAVGLAVGLCCVVAVACASAPSDETPSGALRMFLDAMDRSSWDEGALGDAYALLSAGAKHALAQRARLAGSLSGRDFEPWQMLPQGRFRLRFAPRRRGGMRERIDGSSATVVVTGSRSGERAEVPLVREEGGWRIVLEIPDLARVPPD